MRRAVDPEGDAEFVRAALTGDSVLISVFVENQRRKLGIGSIQIILDIVKDRLVAQPPVPFGESSYSVPYPKPPAVVVP